MLVLAGVILSGLLIAGGTSASPEWGDGESVAEVRERAPRGTDLPSDDLDAASEHWPELEWSTSRRIATYNGDGYFLVEEAGAEVPDECVVGFGLAAPEEGNAASCGPSDRLDTYGLSLKWSAGSASGGVWGLSDASNPPRIAEGLGADDWEPIGPSVLVRPEQPASQGSA